VVPQAAPPPAEPAPARPPPSRDAIPNWRSELIGRLQQAKRYPQAAQQRGEQGVATVRLTLDRSGHVLSAALSRSSGSDALDQEALAMMHRADPLPPLPVELSGDTLTLTVPVTFSLR
jgi:protein TonB